MATRNERRFRLDTVAERVGRNEALFRSSNERIEDAAEEVEIREGVPFLCECADESCTAIVRLGLDVYERVRSDSAAFINLPGHEVHSRGWGRVVERHPTYVVVQKIGDAAEVAELLDTRQLD
jgi:hypothetical protein